MRASRIASSMAQATKGILIRLPVDEADALDAAIASIEARIKRKMTYTEMIRSLLKDEKAIARVGR